jgi:hypothetical protein
MRGDELESYRDGKSRKITVRSIHALIARHLAVGATTETLAALKPRRGRPRKTREAVIAP